MTLHVVGAGLAGLACALRAADAGLNVVVHEAAKQAGGRCRSFDDPVTGRRLDNGTHVIVSGNDGAFDYLRRIGSRNTLRALPSVPPVFDLATGKTWRPGPWQLVRALGESLWRMAFDDRGTVADRMSGTTDYRMLWDPLAVAALNTDANQASAALFRRCVARTVWKGRARMHMVRETLSDTFVDPAVKVLAARGVEIRFARPLKGLKRKNGKVAELEFDDGGIVLSRHDAVVLAVPWWIAGPWLELPELPTSPIVNAHFRVATPPAGLADHSALGIVGGTAQWVFRKGDVLALHVSAAAGLDEKSNDEVAQILWADLARALPVGDAPLAVRVVKEKRATLLHTNEVEVQRPHRRQGTNLLLAGDWTGTGLPCTIEGAIQSGNMAAADAVAMLRDRR